MAEDEKIMKCNHRQCRVSETETSDLYASLQGGCSQSPPRLTFAPTVIGQFGSTFKG